MSLREVSLPAVTGKQLVYKLKANSNSIRSLIFIQCLGLLLSLTGGVSNFSSSYGGLGIRANVYSADIVILFSLFWIFACAMWLPTTQSERWDYTLVSNRLSSNLANIGLLLIYSLFAGVTASLMGYALKLGLYLFSDHSLLVAESFRLNGVDYLLGIAVTILYLLLLASLGYLIGSLMQIIKILILVIPAIALGAAMDFISLTHLRAAVNFFIQESDVLLFGLKVLVTSCLLLAVSALITQRMEVIR